MTQAATSLADKYLQLTGRVFLSSNQALVRLPLEQARRDHAIGLRTAGYISGYRALRWESTTLPCGGRNGYWRLTASASYPGSMKSWR
jgi:hypothetical protein